MLYLDHNSSTPLAEEVIQVITDSLTNCWANPSSDSTEGMVAKELILKTRQLIADMINANTSDEIVITSGGTEANNWCLMSSVKNFFLSGSMGGRKPHIITTNIEHPSIREPLDQLSAEDNSVDVTVVSVSEESGFVSVEDIFAAIRAETCLITVMMANNETGVIQPVPEIGLKLVAVNAERVANGLARVYLHSDAAQTIGKVVVDVQHLNVDYMTIVGHKFYGPRIGALYRRTVCPLLPVLYGGGQESGLRPGTENTAMIAGLGMASQLVTQNITQYNKHLIEIQDYFETQLMRKFADLVAINCSVCPFGRLPNTTSLSFNNKCLIASKILSLTPNLRASLGAACHSSDTKAGKASKVLIASGVSPASALRTIRLSTGRSTTIDDIDSAINELSTAVNRLLFQQRGQ